MYWEIGNEESFGELNVDVLVGFVVIDCYFYFGGLISIRRKRNKVRDNL